MTSADSSDVDQRFLSNARASFIQIAALAVLMFWCYSIVAPFIHVVLWGLIISVALYPTFTLLSTRLGGRRKLAATIIVLTGISIIALPIWLLTDSTVVGLKNVAAQLEDGTASIPPPNESVSEWPLIGEKTYEIWSKAATNVEDVINQFEPQLRALGQTALGLAGSTLGAALGFILSIIIGGALFTSAENGYRVARNISTSLVGLNRGSEFADLTILTVRSVAKGVLGVALIQAIFAAIGLVIAGVPAAGIWTGLVLVLAIVQLPPLLVLGPIAIWYFSVAEPVPATIFFVYAAVVSISDTFLKPFLLGRGVEVPMLVILIGAIGGAIAYGIIGLFVGAIILSLGYELFIAWMSPDEAFAELEEARED